MKKLVQTHRRMTAILNETNEALLRLLAQGDTSLLNTLRPTGMAGFGSSDAQNRPLFFVRPGVNAEEALLHVSLLLKCAEEVGTEVSEAKGVERGLIWSMIHSVEMARAVVDALIDGARVEMPLEAWPSLAKSEEEAH